MAKKIENRITKTCDRCNTTISRDWQFKDYLPINTDGWHTKLGKMICPTCYAHGLILFDKFMKGDL